MNFERNKKYFTSGIVSAKVVIIGLIIGLIGFSNSPGLGILIFAAVGGYIFFAVSGPKDSEIDAEFKKGLEGIVQKGLDKLSIDEEQVNLIEPIVIHGPYYDRVGNTYMGKKGKDNRWRSSNYEVAVLYFSDQQVYCYNNRFSVIENSKNESTDEYFYRDIVSVRTSTDTIDMIDKETGNVEKFQLTTSGGTSISCSVWDSGSVEKSIRGMKQLLRDKKMTASN